MAILHFLKSYRLAVLVPTVVLCALLVVFVSASQLDRAAPNSAGLVAVKSYKPGDSSSSQDSGSSNSNSGSSRHDSSDSGTTITIISSPSHSSNDDSSTSTPPPPPPPPSNSSDSSNSSVTHTINSGSDSNNNYHPQSQPRADAPSNSSSYTPPARDPAPSAPSTPAPSPNPSNNNSGSTTVTVDTGRDSKVYNSHNTGYSPGHYNHYADAAKPKRSRSVYYNYDIYPYIDSGQVIMIAPPAPVYREDPAPVPAADIYDLQNPRRDPLNEAFADIRTAFLAGRFDLIESHIDIADQIAIMTDGKYDYSVPAKDYLDMTYDALEHLQTTGFIWENVKWRTDGTVTGFGVHRFLNSSGRMRAVYISYTLKHEKTDYVIMEVGSSTKPVE